MSNPLLVPTIQSMNQLETAILLEKYVVILAMLNFGSKEERQLAKKEFLQMNNNLDNYVNEITYNVAVRNLDFNEEELYAIQKQHEMPFKHPSSIWKVAIYWFFGLILILTVCGFYYLFTLPNPSSHFKRLMIIAVIVLYIATQFLKWYRYAMWSATKKNELLAHYAKDQTLIYIKYNRFFLNFDQLTTLADNPYSFKKLRQRDLRDVVEY